MSIALVGMRDVKDYLIKSKDGKDVNPGSPEPGVGRDPGADLAIEYGGVVTVVGG